MNNMIKYKKKFSKEQEEQLYARCMELKALLKSYEDYDPNSLEDDPVYDLMEWIADIWYM